MSAVAVLVIHDVITSSSLGKEKIQMLSLSPKEISKANLYPGRMVGRLLSTGAGQSSVYLWRRSYVLRLRSEVLCLLLHCGRAERRFWKPSACMSVT